jgi:hypothetical protein
MRRLLSIVATMLIAAVIVGTTSFVGGAGSGGESFTVVGTFLKAEDIDVGAPGGSPGDYFIEKDALWNEAKTERVGWDVLKCTFDFGTTALCTVGLRFFGRGQLTGTGLVDASSESFTFPVTGGTGDFLDVTGQVRVTQSQDGEILEFHLSGTA